jgi:hypothetical protein
MAKTSASPPKTPPAAPAEDRTEAFAFWTMMTIAIAGAILLLVTGRSPSPAKAKAEPTETVNLPKLIEPAGILDSVPQQFRWTPGGDDVDISQVIIFRGDMTRIWESAPTDSDEVTVPLHMFNLIAPMEPLFWRVREVTDGKPRAASDLMPFKIKNLPQHSPPEEKLAG